ncbi:unnamed protein product [Protopolystoma xenopodis]|uniref:Ion transport domain-containing protein n=1 Tax=Protopolystoma xenopodis TaxID=117903 RepID=A0A3S5FBM8_9PLAT|nr:unnamed protein product [Protopolystoma xenopodis]
MVVDTSQEGYYQWLGLITITVIFNAIVLPMRASFEQFHRLNYVAWMSIDMCIDIIYLMDIFVGIRTGYLDQGLLVRDTALLRRMYLHRRDFFMDLVSILPTDVAYMLPGLSIQSAWVRMNRLIKIYRLFEFVDRTETRTSFPNLFRISTLTIYILVLIHLNACIYFAFSTSTGLGSNSFVYPPHPSDEVSESQFNLTERWNTLYSKYVYSFYWSTLILTTIGETPRPVQDSEYIFITIDFLVGVLIFATVVGNVGSMITNMNATKTEFQNKMDDVKRYVQKLDPVILISKAINRICV